MDLADFPADLVAQAIILSGEPAWPPAAARLVIEFLRRSEVAVLGIELWLAVGEHPRVLGWSEYSVKFTGEWNSYVEENAARALAEVEGAERSERVPEEVLINLTWVSRRELRSSE